MQHMKAVSALFKTLRLNYEMIIRLIETKYLNQCTVISFSFEQGFVQVFLGVSFCQYVYDLFRLYMPGEH